MHGFGQFQIGRSSMRLQMREDATIRLVKFYLMQQRLLFEPKNAIILGDDDKSP